MFHTKHSWTILDKKISHLVSGQCSFKDVRSYVPCPSFFFSSFKTLIMFRGLIQTCMEYASLVLGGSTRTALLKKGGIKSFSAYELPSFYWLFNFSSAVALCFYLSSTAVFIVIAHLSFITASVGSTSLKQELTSIILLSLILVSTETLHNAVFPTTYDFNSFKGGVSSHRHDWIAHFLYSHFLGSTTKLAGYYLYFFLVCVALGRGLDVIKRRHQSTNYSGYNCASAFEHDVFLNNGETSSEQQWPHQSTGQYLSLEILISLVVMINYSAFHSCDARGTCLRLVESIVSQQEVTKRRWNRWGGGDMTWCQHTYIVFHLQRGLSEIEMAAGTSRFVCLSKPRTNTTDSHVW